jgi:MFS family permease
MIEKPTTASSGRGLRVLDFLALNPSTLALLGAIFLVTAATELWSPLVPEYLKALQREALSFSPRLILLIGAYGFLRDALEAVNYFVGGGIGAWFNTRRALIAFNLLPLIGLCLLALMPSWIGVLLAIPFIFVWDSIAGPAVVAVVGESVPPGRRTMAFSMQSIFKRVSRIFVYSLSGLIVWTFGRVEGFRLAVGLAVLFVLSAAFLQFRYQRTAARDARVMIHRPFTLLASFDPQLKRLLISDIFSRWAEGMAGPFVILFCVPLLAEQAATGTAIYQSVMLNIQAATCIVLYLVIGPLASREGLAKKPFIGLTFVFFALFPISVVVLGPMIGFWGLALAFLVGGFREIGEPARKAMVADLVPRESRTQAIGLYWSVRGLAVMAAAPVGAVLWVVGERWRAGFGPYTTFLSAGALGVLGAVFFFMYFGRGVPRGDRRPSARA